MAAAYKEMASVLGGPQGLLQYMMLQNNTYEKLAKANASAVQGLQPKITVWNTGNEASTADAGAPIRNLFQTLPPLLGTIQDQTGMRPPNWFAQMPEMGMDQGKANGAGQLDMKAAVKAAKVNGA
jgi:flotillin